MKCRGRRGCWGKRGFPRLTWIVYPGQGDAGIDEVAEVEDLVYPGTFVYPGTPPAGVDDPLQPKVAIVGKIYVAATPQSECFYPIPFLKT